MSPLKRKATEELVSSPSPKRLLAAQSIHEELEEQQDLLRRIQECVEYTQSQAAKGETALQTTRFAVSTSPPRPALELLRRYGKLVLTLDKHEVREIGCPRPDWVTQGIVPGGVHDPQWWLNKTLAEVKAGPYAKESDVKRAAAHLKGLETKRGKKKAPTAREKEIEGKLRRGLQWQEDEEEEWEEAESETTSLSQHNLDAGHQEESSLDEDDMPIKRGVRPSVAKALKAQRLMKELAEVDSEDDLPRKRGMREMVGTKRRASSF